MTANSDEKRMDAVSSCSFQRTRASRRRSPSPYLRQSAVLRNCLCCWGTGPFHAPRSRARKRTLDRAGRRSRGARAPQKTSTRSLMWGATAGRAIGCPIELKDGRAAREPHKEPATDVSRGARPPGAQPAQEASRNRPHRGERPGTRRGRVQRPTVALDGRDPAQHRGPLHGLVPAH